MKSNGASPRAAKRVPGFFMLYSFATKIFWIPIYWSIAILVKVEFVRRNRKDGNEERRLAAPRRPSAAAIRELACGRGGDLEVSPGAANEVIQ